MSTLSWAWRDIADAGLAGFKGFTVLHELDLSNCANLTDLAGLQCPQLTTLDVSSCAGLTDAGLASLPCPLITSLDVSSCHGLTDAGLECLQCPSLLTLGIYDCKFTAGLLISLRCAGVDLVVDELLSTFTDSDSD